MHEIAEKDETGRDRLGPRDESVQLECGAHVYEYARRGAGPENARKNRKRNGIKKVKKWERKGKEKRGKKERKIKERKMKERGKGKKKKRKKGKRGEEKGKKNKQSEHLLAFTVRCVHQR